LLAFLTFLIKLSEQVIKTLITNNNVKSLQKNICTCDDEEHGPKTEQQSNKELNHHLHQSSFLKTLLLLLLLLSLFVATGANKLNISMNQMNLIFFKENYTFE